MGWKISDLVPFLLRNEGTVYSPSCCLSESSESPVLVNNEPNKGSSVKRDFSVQFERISSKKSSSSGPLPGVSDPSLQTIQEFLKKGQFKVKIRKGTTKKNLFRFLLAKLIYEKEEGLHLDEFLVLWELYLDLLDLTEKDEGFQEKYGFLLEENSKFFEKLSTSSEFPIRIEGEPEGIETVQKCFFPLLPTKSAYFGLKGQKGIRSGFLIQFTSELPIKKIPEGRRVGVGYRDKGSRRDLSKDGSPDWREVSRNSQEEIIRSVEVLTGCSRDSDEFNWDLVNNPIELKLKKDSGRQFSGRL